MPSPGSEISTPEICWRHLKWMVKRAFDRGKDNIPHGQAKYSGDQSVFDVKAFACFCIVQRGGEFNGQGR